MVCVDLCLWARVLAFVFGCLSFRINAVVKLIELGRFWALSEGGTYTNPWNDPPPVPRTAMWYHGLNCSGTGFGGHHRFLLLSAYVVIRLISAPIPPPARAGAGARREFRRRAKR
jgi:hypothetical protein